MLRVTRVKASSSVCSVLELPIVVNVVQVGTVPPSRDHAKASRGQRGSRNQQDIRRDTTPFSPSIVQQRASQWQAQEHRQTVN